MLQYTITYSGIQHDTPVSYMLYSHDIIRSRNTNITSIITDSTLKLKSFQTWMDDGLTCISSIDIEQLEQVENMSSID